QHPACLAPEAGHAVQPAQLPASDVAETRKRISVGLTHQAHRGLLTVSAPKERRCLVSHERNM
ncbi:MAG: hypothetical protein AAGJ94_05785, partial [Pseudomonadota bacterium]